MIKNFLCVVGLAFGLQTAWGFALLGPVAEPPGPGGNGLAVGDTWQTVTLTYNPLVDWDTARIGPKNLGEEYRRNTPVMYYAFDANYSRFFGSNGEVAVEQAFDILNSLTNVDNYSPSLTEFPMNSQSVNYTAQGAGLKDVKSMTLHLMIEQMGLINPVRYVWTLHSREVLPGGSCTAGNVEYEVVQRNFDITASPLNQLQYSSYVNGTLYSYIIAEYCSAQFSPFFPDVALADAVEFPVDPLASVFTPVAADGGWLIANPAVPPFQPPIFTSDALFPFGFGLAVGGFYTGLTRDDVAGLRYLMSTNTVNFEPTAPGSVLLSSSGGGVGGVTYGPPTLLYTSNYNAFWLTAQTTDPVTLSNLFPGLVILNSSYYYTNIVTPNIVTYTTNLIGSPYGEQVIVVTTNGVTSNLEQIFSYTFANLDILTNGFSPNTSASLVSYSILPQTGAPYGSPFLTNATTKTIILTNVPSGEYYINTNYLCGPPLFQSLLETIVTPTTNFIYSASNSLGEALSESLVIYSTTHVYQVEWPICGGVVVSTGNVANVTGSYQGIGRIQFVRVADQQVDPLTGNFTVPITNYYTEVLYDPTDSQWETQTFQRLVTRPDVLFDAADMSGQLPVFSALARSINFNDTDRLPGLAGPGTILPSTTITFNKVGDVFLNGPLNTTNAFLDEASQSSLLAWGSFDETTNAPIVYPNGTSIQNLENQLVVQVAPTSLPNGTNGAVYAGVTFTATGGGFIAPFTWSAIGLPTGLTVSPTGTLSGTPTQSGTFDFTLMLTDSSATPRSVQWTVPITIQ